jgi:hypothetical protein
LSFASPRHFALPHPKTTQVWPSPALPSNLSLSLSLSLL